MIERYRRIALTYIQWKWFWIPTLCLVWFTLDFMLGFRLSSDRVLTFSKLLLGVFLFAGFLGLHLKHQLAQPAVRLLPHFPESHLFTALAVSFPFLVVLPAVLICRLGFSLLGGLALVASGIFIALSWSYSASIWIGWLIVGLFLVVSQSTAAAQTYLTVLEGDVEPFALFLLLSSLSGIAVLALRFMRLNEEMPEYSEMCGSAWSRRAWESAGTECRGWRAPLAMLKRVSRNLVGREAGRPVPLTNAGFWRRARHRLVGLAPNVHRLFPPLLFMAIVMSGLQTRRTGEGTHFLLDFSMIMPGAVVIGLWSHRRLLGMELLRPATRGQFVGELALAVGTWQLQVWAMIAGAGLLGLALWSPRSLTVSRTLGFLLVSGATQAFVFGALFLAMSSHWPRASSILTLLLLATPLGFLGHACWAKAGRLALSHALLAACLLLAFGGLLMRAACRKWYRLELG